MPGQPPIYLDHHATTPCDPRVVAAMLPFFSEHFGNAASKSHPYGWRADDAVAKARTQVAQLIGAEAKEIVFTSGATESDNLAIKGAARARKDQGRHIVTSRVEHKAVIDPIRALEKEGFAVTWLEPDPDGTIAPARVEDALRDDTVLVALMHGNNEIGTVLDAAAIGTVCRAHGALFFTDAVQTVGQIPVDVSVIDCDLLSLSGHKMYGPKGVGALYVRRRPRVRLSPLIDGGGHERGMRSGTLNVPGIVGLGAAAAIADESPIEGQAGGLTGCADAIARRRDGLLARLREHIPDLVVHGTLDDRLPGNLNVGIPHVEAEALLLRVNHDVALSTGSACTSATLEPSHVLRGIGVPHDLAHCSIRLGVGRHTTDDEIERAAEKIGTEANALRRASPLYARDGDG